MKHTQLVAFKNLAAKKIQKAYWRYRVKCVQKTKQPLARHLLVALSSAMSIEYEAKALDPLKSFMLTFSSIVDLRSRVVQYGTSIQLI